MCREYKASPWAEPLAQPSGIWVSLGVPVPLPPLLHIAFPGFFVFCTDIHPRKDNIESTMSTKHCVGGKESEKIVCPEELHFPARCCCHDSSRGKKRDGWRLKREVISHMVQDDNELVFFCLSPSVVSISLHPSVPETAHIWRCHCYTELGSQLILYLALFFSMQPWIIVSPLWADRINQYQRLTYKTHLIVRSVEPLCLSSAREFRSRRYLIFSK